MSFISALLLAPGLYLYFDLETATVEDILLWKSKSLGESLFLWPGMNINVTKAEIQERFAQEIAPLQMGMAIVNIIADLFMWLILYSARDTLLLSSVYISQLAKSFRKKLLQIEKSNRAVTWDQLTNLYKEYRFIQSVSSSIDHVFGALFKFLHFFNLLVCSYCALEVLHGNAGISEFLIYAICYAKIWATYYFAMQASDTVMK